MFRSLVIAVTLVGMALCQYRCMGPCAASETGREATPREAALAGCDCCHSSRESAPPCESPRPDEPCPDESPEPCCPGNDGDCHCQGICGGALTGEVPVLDGLLQAWAFAAVNLITPQDFSPCISCESQYVLGNPAAAGAPDGRAVRILIASLQT